MLTFFPDILCFVDWIIYGYGVYSDSLCGLGWDTQLQGLL